MHKNTDFKILKSFKQPTDIIILGLGDDMEDPQVEKTNFKITDDESGFLIFENGGKKTSVSSLGFGCILTLDEYLKWKSSVKDTSSIPTSEWIEDGLISGVIVLNFVGDIGIGAIDFDEDILSTDFDLDDYICHQVENSEVVINIPSGFEIHKLDENLNVPTSVLRNITIEKINQ